MSTTSTTPNSNAGKRTTCERCAKPCVIAPDRKTDARVAVESNSSGLCPECISTAMFKSIVEGDVYTAACFAAFTRDGLRLPHVQKQFAAVLAAGGSRLPVERLDWDQIIANWDLPVPKKYAGGLFS